jgi:hypothetical protein
VFFDSLGPRVDIAAAAETTRFLFKFVVTGMLVVTAVPALLTLARPEGVTPGRLIPLIAAPLLLTAALLLEMVAVPASDWGTRLVGVNMPYCLTYIPLIGLGPLALFILALRRRRHRRDALRRALHRRLPAFRGDLVHDRDRDAHRPWRVGGPGVRPLVTLL